MFLTIEISNRKNATIHNFKIIRENKIFYKKMVILELICLGLKTTITLNIQI